ncbi:MAG: recombinase family protein [Bacteroidota bacterium]|nr:recombinase family protein [Bacteroidota bacterium]
MSLDTQKSACEKYAKENHYRILGQFGGTYESAKTDERIEFNNMLKFVRRSKEKVSFILVFSVDRFSRSGANAIYIAEQLKNVGVNLISVMQPADISTPSGALQQNIQFIFSEYDNQLRREKTITGMRNMLLRGDWCTKPPRGYDIIRINSKRSIVINKEGEILRKAFLWLYYERLSQSAIIDRLLALGLKIGKSNLSSILQNPFYCGILSSRSLQGKVVHGNHEKLISQELFLDVNEILRGKRIKGTTWGMDSPELPLKIVMRCFDCGSPFVGYVVKKKNLYYYKCRLLGCCNNRSQVKIHDLFKNLLSQVRIDNFNYPNVQKEFLSNFIRIERLNRANAASFTTTLSNIKRKINDLEERFISREIPENLYLKHIDKLNAEKLKVEAEVDKAKTGLYIKRKIKERSTELLSNLHRVWHFGDLQVKRIIQSTIFPEGLFYNKHLQQLVVKKIAPGFILGDSEPNVEQIREI